METLHIFIILVTLTQVTLTLGQSSTPSMTITITEEEDSGKQIGSVSEIQLNVPEEEKDTLRYSFLTTDYQQYFSLQDTSGNLFTMVKIDRESICTTFQTTQCELDFRVAAKTEGQFYQTIGVKVIIEDINDNAPLFDQDQTELRIPEGLNSVNNKYGIRSADDPDTGINGIQGYEINPPSDKFDLISEQLLDGTFNLEIIVKQELNREAQDSYQVRIIAKDGGDPVKSGTLTVDIVVTDVNDNKPEFNQTSYNVSVEEGTTQGSTVLTVHAEDLDSGDNGLVSYRISDRFPQILNDFTINQTSGEIKVVKEKLEFQPDFHYSFIVEAIDNGEQPQVSQVYVYIYVADTRNNPPTVTVNLLSPGNIGFVNVSENSIKGSFVAHVTVEDTDTGSNGQVTCSVSNNFFDVIKLQEEGAYKVVVGNTLNREVLDLHNVTVTCMDGGDPRLESSVSFLVRVTDFNDNKPVFEVLNYQAKVAENKPEEQIILQVSASDKDIGVNQQIHYEIRNQDKIAVNAITGVISVKPFFDREITPVVMFEVLAIDAGQIPLTGTATVTLTIEDENDNKPTFTQESYEFEILENLNSGTTVNKVFATDADIGANGIFTFSLSPNSVSDIFPFPFHVFADGVIQSNQALDREYRSRYNFDIIVTDQGSPPLSSIVPVTVFVKDVNDNRPNITFPTKENKTVSVLYPSEEVEIVTRIKAHDIDAGENGSLKYSITKGNELGLFSINDKTGTITVADNTIQIEQDISIAVLVEVRDEGAISLASTAELIIDVIYTNATNEAVSSGSSKFVVIVVVVVVVTVLLSGIIIGLIFLIRTFDRKKKLNESKSHVSENGYANKQTLFITNNTGESSTDYMVTNLDGARKKKEVSFSLDEHDSINNYQHTDLHVSLTPDPVHYTPEKPPRRVLEKTDSTQDLYDKVTTRLESLKLQQKMLQLSKQPQQQVSHPDDSRSETSGETSSGDSGRGASEEEVTSASPSHDDQKMFEYSVPVKNMNSSTRSVPSSRADNYSVVPPPIPCRTYKPYGSFNNNQSYSPSQRQYLNAPLHHSSDLSVLDPSLLSWQHSQSHSHQPIKSNGSIAERDYYFVGRDAQYRKRSQDDDDCSTTTSGSYTLHSIDDLL